MRDTRSTLPELIHHKYYNNETIKQIAAQEDVTYILTTDNIYVFGNCKNGMCAQY